MIRRLFSLCVVLVILALCCCVNADDALIALPAVKINSKVTIEQAIQQRRSVRTYSLEPVSLQQVSQLLWAAQGITDAKTGHRTTPSAVGTYPLTVYLVAANVKDLPMGIYEYIPDGHKLKAIKQGDQRVNIGSQKQMTSAPVLLVYIADYKVTGQKFSIDKAKEFACIEVGHSAQNVLLEEIAQGLVGVGMAGFDSAKITAKLSLTKSQEPLYVVSAGNRAK